SGCRLTRDYIRTPARSQRKGAVVHSPRSGKIAGRDSTSVKLPERPNEKAKVKTCQQVGAQRSKQMLGIDLRTSHGEAQCSRSCKKSNERPAAECHLRQCRVSQPRCQRACQPQGNHYRQQKTPSFSCDGR